MTSFTEKNKIILEYTRNKKTENEIHEETGIPIEVIKKCIKEYEQHLDAVRTGLSK